MPYIKIRSRLSPIFSDDYQIFEWITTPPKEYYFQQEIWLYDSITDLFPQERPIIISEDVGEPYEYQQDPESAVFYFQRFTNNPNKLLRQFSDYIIPTGTFSSKYELERFQRNFIQFETDDYLFENDETPTGYDVTTSKNYVYYGWNELDSRYIVDEYLINYIESYGTASSFALTQSYLFTTRPEVSDTAGINYIPAVIWSGGPTLSIFHVSEFNSNNQILSYNTFTLTNSNDDINPVYLKFKKPANTVDYVQVWVGPTAAGATATSLPTARTNRVSKLYTLRNKCKELNEMNLITIVFQNKFGTFDSYDFLELESIKNVTKNLYDSGLNIEVNRSVPIDYTVPVGLPQIYIDSKRKFQKQSRINNLKSETTKTITTENVDKETLKWLEEMIRSENVFEWTPTGLKPINILQNSIQNKSINNIYSQLRLNYRYSQKQETR